MFHRVPRNKLHQDIESFILSIKVRIEVLNQIPVLNLIKNKSLYDQFDLPHCSSDLGISADGHLCADIRDF